MRRLLCVLAFLTVGTAAAAQTPCELPVSTLSANPGRLFVTSMDHMTSWIPSGDAPVPQWLIESYEVRYYPQGTPAPFASFNYPRAAFTAVAGVPNCYTIAHSNWLLTPNVVYRAVAIARTNPLALDAAGNRIPDSAPSEESNPFWLPGPPRRPVTRVQ